MATTAATCGFVPCPDGYFGTVFITAVYGGLTFYGSSLMSMTCERLLRVMSPTVVGALILPILGVLANCVVIASPAIFPKYESMGDAKKAAALDIGAGILAGSTVLFATFMWGVSVLVGRCDLDTESDGVLYMREHQLTRPAALWSTGVVIGDSAKRSAQLMLASVSLYAIVQIPSWAGVEVFPFEVVGALVCLFAFLAYSLYHIAYPEVQRQRLLHARIVYMRAQLITHCQQLAMVGAGTGLVDAQGQPDVAALGAVFDALDTDKAGFITLATLRSILATFDIATAMPGDATSDAERWARQFGANKLGEIDRDAFIDGMKRFVSDHHRARTRAALRAAEMAMTPGTPKTSGFAIGISRPSSQVGVSRCASTADLSSESSSSATASGKDPEAATDGGSASAASAGGGDGAAAAGDADVAGIAGLGRMSWRELAEAVAILLAGVAICCVVGNPLIDSLAHLSDLLNVPSFGMGFVLGPIAANLPSVVTCIQLATLRQSDTVSMALEQAIGLVTVNNTLVLAVFYATAAAIGTTAAPWHYGSETVASLIPTLFLFALSCHTSLLRTWTAFATIAMYPLSLFLYWLFTHIGLGR